MSKRKSAKTETTADEGFHVPRLAGRTPKQKDYLDALRTTNQVFAIGPAGTGKTWLPSAYSAELLRDGQIDKIILTCPNVPAGPTLGHFPGTMDEKMAPWVIPFIEAMADRITKAKVYDYLRTGLIEIAPFETMRGRTFRDSYIIVDEAQNLTPKELYMVMTRVGEDSFIVVTGDYEKQKDIRGDSGLPDAIDKIERFNIPAAVIRFGPEDVVRSGICRQWVLAYL